MSHLQDISYALTDLEQALQILRDKVVMPVSGSTYRFYYDAKGDLERAHKALKHLHEEPIPKAIVEPDYVEPTSCYCHITSHPPCGYCERSVE